MKHMLETSQFHDKITASFVFAPISRRSRCGNPSASPRAARKSLCRTRSGKSI